MPFQGGIGGNKAAMFYGGGQVPNPANVIVQAGTPSTNARSANIGDIYVDKSTSIPYICVASTGAAGGTTWEQLGLATGSVGQINGSTGTALPSAGVITIAGTANQITTAASGSTVTLTLPSAITAPGSVTATTTVTATLGNITATNGNFVASAAGSGIVVPAAAVGPGDSPQVSNARAGSVTFSSVSIAAAATQTFVITNSTITGASTKILFSLVGATTGSALTIQSYTPSAGSVSVVIMNGTGATTTTANITLDYLVLN